jgi:prevent-host-death family protein
MSSLRSTPARYTLNMPKAPHSEPVEVGVRELRDHLSSWLDRVEAGDEVIITDRGRPVARLTPTSGRARLDRLIDEGIVTPAKRPRRPLPPPTIRLRGITVEELVAEQRR